MFIGSILITTLWQTPIGNYLKLIVMLTRRRIVIRIAEIRILTYETKDNWKLKLSIRFHFRPLRAHPRESDGSIVIVDVSVSDAKTYTCADAETNDSLVRFDLHFQ